MDKSALKEEAIRAFEGHVRMTYSAPVAARARSLIRWCDVYNGAVYIQWDDRTLPRLQTFIYRQEGTAR